MLICSGSPLCNGRYGRPRGVSLRLRWQLRKGRAGSRAALQLWEYSRVHTGGTGSLTWEVVYVFLEDFPPKTGHGKERKGYRGRDTWEMHGCCYER